MCDLKTSVTRRARIAERRLNSVPQAPSGFRAIRAHMLSCADLCLCTNLCITRAAIFDLDASAEFWSTCKPVATASFTYTDWQRYRKSNPGFEIENPAARQTGSVTYSRL